MTILTIKRDLLNQAGYRYSFDRDIYFNRQTKKAFSVEFIEDHDEHELRRRITGNAPKNGWQFFFNSDPAESVKRELEKVLG